MTREDIYTEAQSIIDDFVNKVDKFEEKYNYQFVIGCQPKVWEGTEHYKENPNKSSFVRDKEFVCAEIIGGFPGYKTVI